MKRISDPAYDIVLESNMLNQYENVSYESLAGFSEGFFRILRDQGHVILIEPGKQALIPVLKKATDNAGLKMTSEPKIMAVDTSSITLMNQCLETGLRRKVIKEHWYSVVIAERKSS